MYGGFDRISLAKPKSATLTTSPFTYGRRQTDKGEVGSGITQLREGVETDQHIFWFDIAMKESVFMHEGQTLEDLIHDVANLRFRKVFVSIFHQLVKVSIHEFKNKEELIILSNNFF